MKADPFYSNASRRSANMLGEELRRYEARIAALKEALVAAKNEHRKSDMNDPYEMCDVSNATIPLKRRVCDCGTDAHNAAIDVALKADAAMARGDEPTPEPAT